VNLEARIAKLLESTAAAIVHLVREDVSDRIDAVLAARGGAGRGKVLARSRRMAKSPNIKPCRVPGCGKPSKGPRFHFLCAEHRDLPKAKIQALLKASESKAGAKAAK
jgi:hypothetical protein